MAQYRTGTATFTNGSQVVTGTGTSWLSSVSAGDWIVRRGTSAITYDPCVVGSVDSDTQITLVDSYTGDTATDVEYIIHIDFLPNGAPRLNNGDVNPASVMNRHLGKTVKSDDIGTAAYLDQDNVPLALESIEDIPDLSGYADGQKFDITGYYSGTTVGGGTLVKATGRHDGVIYFDPSRVSEIGTSAYYVDSGSDAVCAMRVDPFPLSVEDAGAASGIDSADAYQAAIDATGSGDIYVIESETVTPSSLDVTTSNNVINFISSVDLPDDMPGVVERIGQFTLPETSFQSDRTVRIHNYEKVDETTATSSSRQYVRHISGFMSEDGTTSEKEFRGFSYDIGTDVSSSTSPDIRGIKGRVYANGGVGNLRGVYSVCDAVEGSGFTGLLTGFLATVYTNSNSVSEAVGYRAHMSDGSTTGFEVAGTGKSGETGAPSYGYRVRTGTGQPGMPTVAHYMAHGGSGGDMFLGLASNTDTSVDNAPFRVKNSGQTKVTSVYSGEETIIDDGVLAITPPDTSGMISIYSKLARGAFGKVFFRTADGVTDLAYGGAIFEIGDGVPTGTTGTDGYIGVYAASDGNVYIENRTGSARSVVWLFDAES